MTKDLLIKQLEREQKYCEDHEVGTEEYNNSLRRCMELEKQLSDLEMAEKEAKAIKNDRLVRNIIEGVKVTGGIVLPVVGLIGITAFEKDATFTSALKGYVSYFLPNRK